MDESLIKAVITLLEIVAIGLCFWVWVVDGSLADSEKGRRAAVALGSGAALALIAYHSKEGVFLVAAALAVTALMAAITLFVSMLRSASTVSKG